MGANADLLLTAYDAWNREDCDAWLALLAEDIEILTSGVFPDLAPSYRGHSAAAKFWRQMHEPWEEFRIDAERIEDGDDWAAAAIRFRGRGADSGIEVDMQFSSAVTVRDGVAIELVNRRTLEEARDALRLRGVENREHLPSRG